MKNFSRRIRLYSTLIILLSVCFFSKAYAGTYLNSAHGDAASGVNRSSTSALGYVQGNCAHCHEQHGIIEGKEPAPIDGAPSNFLLYTDTNPTSQTTNFCFQCHQTGGSLQVSGITNNDYSTTFGGQGTPSTVSIDDAFNPLLGSAHDLVDVRTELLTATFSPPFTADKNPCGGCHNPHLAQKNNTVFTNTAISLPSKPNELWGDIPGETMQGYTAALVTIPAAAYRAPFYAGANPAPLPTANHEPDGQPGSVAAVSPNVVGANTPDYTTFCLDCHKRQVLGTNPGRTVPIIPWAIGNRYSQHGPEVIGADLNGGNRIGPYTIDGSSVTGEDRTTNFVLSCLDCHEPHGASQTNGEYLLRTTVNGIDIDASAPGGIGITGPGQWYYFCIACHTMTNGAGAGFVHGLGIGPGSTCNNGSCHGHSGNTRNF